jgi:hypothetical protein
MAIADHDHEVSSFQLQALFKSASIRLQRYEEQRSTCDAIFFLNVWV